MSHKHINLLRAIFHDPVSGNIHWREIESLLHHLGASVDPRARCAFPRKFERLRRFPASSPPKQCLR